MVTEVKMLAGGWNYDVVSIVYPVVGNRLIAEPHILKRSGALLKMSIDLSDGTCNVQYGPKPSA
jgi:hypothetical protein